MTLGTFNGLIAHTGTYAKIETSENKEEKYIWLMLKPSVPEGGDPEHYKDAPLMRVVAPGKTPAKALIDKMHMMVLQSGVRMTIMAMAEKMDEQKAAEEGKQKIIKQEVGIIKK